MTLLIDNYDSFTNNLYDYLSQLNQEIVIIKNDEKTIEEIEGIKFDNILISPGPKWPIDAGITLSLIARYHKEKPILGVCLGHQAIGAFFGAKLTKAERPMHGFTSSINLVDHELFENIPNSLMVMRYHSLVLSELPESLIELGVTEKGENMIFKHRDFPILGIQFHPEAILTEYGIIFLRNWFNYVKKT